MHACNPSQADTGDIQYLPSGNVGFPKYEETAVEGRVRGKSSCTIPCIVPKNLCGGKSTCAIFGSLRSDDVIVMNAKGVACRVDYVQNEIMQVYSYWPTMNIEGYNECWVVRAAGLDGEQTLLVVAKNGKAFTSGFCSWDLHSGLRQGAHEHGAALASGPSTFYNQPFGPFMLQSATGTDRMHLYDVRDGQQLLAWNLGEPVPYLRNSSPTQWFVDDKIVASGRTSVSVWDVNQNPASPLHRYKCVYEWPGGIRTMDIPSRVRSDTTLPARSSFTSGDGVVASNEHIHVMDFRTPCTIPILIAEPYSIVHCCTTHDDSIVLGCTKYATHGDYQPAEVIMEVCMRQRRTKTLYYIPEAGHGEDSTIVSQVVADGKRVIGLCHSVYVFESLTGSGLNEVARKSSHETVNCISNADDCAATKLDMANDKIVITYKDGSASWMSLM